MKALVSLFIFAFALSIHAEDFALEAGAKRYEITVLNVATFAGNGWTAEDIQRQIEAVNVVFAQCNVRVGTVKVHEIKNYTLPPVMDGRVHQAPNGAVAIRKATSEVPQPAIYLIGQISPSSAFTKAVMRVNAPPCEPEIENTIWIPADVNTPEYQNGRHTRPFATLAHELTHLLTLEGMHNGDLPHNQLSSYKNRTDLMTAEMCSQIWESVFVREIKNSK